MHANQGGGIRGELTSDEGCMEFFVEDVLEEQHAEGAVSRFQIRLAQDVDIALVVQSIADEIGDGDEREIVGGAVLD